MAPEVFKKNYNEKCDEWSMGVLLYYILSGHFPFNGRSIMDLKHKIIKGHYSAMEGYPWDES